MAAPLPRPRLADVLPLLPKFFPSKPTTRAQPLQPYGTPRAAHVTFRSASPSSGSQMSAAQ